MGLVTNKDIKPVALLPDIQGDPTDEEQEFVDGWDLIFPQNVDSD